MKSLHWHIIGLGWLGSAVAKSLLESGARVSGTCRSREKAQVLQQINGLEVTLWDSNTESASHIPPGVTHLLFAVPPSGREASLYAAAIAAVVAQLSFASPNAKFIFTSSTSVYPEAPGRYDENAVVKGEGSQVIQAAEEVLFSSNICYWIIRLSGLAGYGRVPGRYFAGRQVEGDKTVNLIHRDDIVSFILQFADNSAAQGIVNLTCPEQVTRRALYTLNSQQYGFEIPVFLDSEPHIRQIVSMRENLFQEFTFRYQTPLQFPVE